MSKKRLVTMMDSESFSKFRARARALGLSDAALLRKVVELHLISNQNENQAHKFDDVAGSKKESMQIACTLRKGFLTKVDQVAKQQGMTRDTFLKSALMERLNEKHPQRPSIRECEPDDFLKQVTLRIPKFLMRRLRHKAQAMQMKISPWISCLIQSTLIKEPVLSHNQDMKLERSNRELAAIGRNLNQIARSMHQNLNHNIELSLSEIEVLKKAIETNKLAIREIVAVSQQKWGYFDK